MHTLTTLDRKRTTTTEYIQAPRNNYSKNYR